VKAMVGPHSPHEEGGPTDEARKEVTVELKPDKGLLRRLNEMDLGLLGSLLVRYVKGKRASLLIRKRRWLQSKIAFYEKELPRVEEEARKIEGSLEKVEEDLAWLEAMEDRFLKENEELRRRLAAREGAKRA